MYDDLRITLSLERGWLFVSLWKDANGVAELVGEDGIDIREIKEAIENYDPRLQD